MLNSAGCLRLLLGGYSNQQRPTGNRQLGRASVHIWLCFLSDSKSEIGFFAVHKFDSVAIFVTRAHTTGAFVCLSESDEYILEAGHAKGIQWQ
jgi:hypothetical protein